MVACFLGLSNSIFFWGLAVLAALYLASRIILGQTSRRAAQRQLVEEGLIRSQRWVRVGMRFPLILRTTFCHVYLSRRRLLLFHCLTGVTMLQAPTGPEGSPGKEGGRFEVEQKGGREVLVFRTTMRGGGRIRLHMNDADAWLEDIRRHA